MEKIFEQALLYDFYGELLTAHQRSVYEDAVYNDMSLSEIAEGRGISRQGVHDLLKRCDRILQDYESKLHLVRKFAEAKEQFGRIMALTEPAVETDGIYACRDGELGLRTEPAACGLPEGAELSSGPDRSCGPLRRLEENMRQIREISRQWMDNF